MLQNTAANAIAFLIGLLFVTDAVLWAKTIIAVNVVAIVTTCVFLKFDHPIDSAMRAIKGRLYESRQVNVFLTVLTISVAALWGASVYGISAAMSFASPFLAVVFVAIGIVVAGTADTFITQYRFRKSIRSWSEL